MTRMISVSEDALNSLKAMAEQDAKDAARWRKARDFLSIEDIEYWSSDEMKGHQPEEHESLKADAAIDAAMQTK